MAQKAAKALAARNSQKLNVTLITTAVVHAFFLLYRAFYSRRAFGQRSLMLYIILSLPSLLIQGWFEASGRPTYGNHPGEVKNGGEDLNAPGLMEWLWDVIYWTYGCVLLSALGGDKGWWFWLAIPSYSAYLLYSTYGGARQAMAGQSDGTATAPESASKRQQKLEKKGQKVHYR